MTTHESVIGFKWLYSTLKNDATLSSLCPGGVFRSLAPDGTTTPFIIMSLQSASDVVTMNGYRFFDDILYQVKVVGPASISTQIATASTRIDTLLKRTSGTTADGAILSCIREQPLSIDELVNGALWSNIGGLYRLLIEQFS